MKKQILSLFTFVLSIGLIAQTSLFSEDFEGVTNQFTSTAAISSTASWSLNTTVANSGTNSFQGPIITRDTLWFESVAFSTIGSPSINLSFSHIAKVDFFDKAIVQYSNNNGVTWITANAADYIGSGNFIGNSFSSVSYLDWQPGLATAIPTNSWWKTDQFNLPLLSNVTQAKIRFVIYDGDNTGSLGNYGWVIDDVEVVGSACELIPPSLSNDIDLSGLQYTANPLPIGINATDASGIASVKAFFTINSGLLDSTTLSASAGSRYLGTLSGFQVGDTVCYYYQVIDNTSCGNTSLMPSTSCYQFIVRAAPPIPCLGTPINSFPYAESFSGFSASNPFNLINNWENSTADDLDWEINSGPTGSGGTGPTGDHTTGTGNYIYLETSGQQNNDEAHLITPCYDLTNISNGEFSFWYHMLGQTMGELRLDIYANNQWNLDIMTPKIGSQGQNWLKEVVNLSAYAGQVVKFRFRGIRGTSFTGDIALDDIELFNLSGDDAAVDSVTIANNINCQSSTPEDVNLFVTNRGTTTLTSIPVAYQVNGGAIVRDTIVGNLAPGISTAFTFSRQAVLVSTSSNFTIRAWAEVNGDIRLLNDTSVVNQSISPTVSTLPYTENFDSFVVGIPGTLLNGWANDPLATALWTVNTGFTAVNGTGPSGDRTTGNGNYLYIPSFSSGFNAQVELTSPCYDLTGLTNPDFSFWYHMFGQDVGELHLDVFANNQWNLDVISPIIGDQGDVWLNTSINLSSYIGQSVKVRFRGVTLFGIQGDIAIDDISLFDVVGDDVTIDSITVANNISCQSSTLEDITISLTNLGTTTLTSVPVAYQINNGVVVRDTFVGNVLPGNSSVFTFAQQALLTNTSGIFDIESWTELPSDIRLVNDTSIIEILISPTNSSFPYSESFDSFTVGAPGTFLNGWGNDPTNVFDWRVGAGPTPNPGTGPSSDHTSGVGNYLFIQSFSGPANSQVDMVSPCYDLVGVTNPEFSFWYHMFGQDIGELHLDVFANNQWNLDVITPIIGNQGDLWRFQTADLRPYIGQIINVRFRGVTTFGFQGDIAIDDIALFDVTGIDAAVDSIVVAGNSSCQSALPQPISATISNRGSIALNLVPMAYQINNGAIVRDTFVGNLAPGASQSFTFTQQSTLTGGSSNFIIDCWSELPGDIRTLNDSTSESIQFVQTVNTFPFTENFDLFVTGTPGTLLNGWTNNQNDDLDWNVNSGNTNSTNTGPSRDQNSANGNGNYLYIETSGGGFPLNATALLESNCIDLTGVGSPQLSFWYHMFGATIGELHVDLINNGIVTLDIMTPIIGNQGNQWTNQTIDLSAYVGQVVQLRFRGLRGSSFTGDIAIDNIQITQTNTPLADVGIASSVSPQFSGCQPSTVQLLSVVVENYSGITTSVIPVAYQLNSNQIVRDTFRVIIPPFGSSIFTFPNPITFSSGNNDLRVWTDLAGDPSSLNDTLSQQLQLTSPLSIFPVTEDFETFTPGTPGTFVNGWNNELINDTHDWYVNSRTTPTSGTGPLGDHTSGIGNYLYVNATGFSGTSARVLSQCYDLTNANMPELDFWYHMSGSDIGALHIDLDVNGFYVQDIIAPITGDQGVNWVNRVIPLSGYGSIVRIVFRADVISKTGTITGDIAIDDIMINVTPVGIGENQFSFDVSTIYPNPTDGLAAIDITVSEAMPLQYQLMDMRGRILEEHSTAINKGSSTINIDVRNYESGVYFYRLMLGEKIVTKKLIVH